MENEEDWQDADYDPFASLGMQRQKSDDEFRKQHNERMSKMEEMVTLLHHRCDLMHQTMEMMHKHMSSPKKIIRDQQGRAIGMESG